MTSKKLGALFIKIAHKIIHYWKLFIIENYSLAIISQKTDLSFPLPQRFKKTFAHKSKY